MFEVYIKSSSTFYHSLVLLPHVDVRTLKSHHRNVVLYLPWELVESDYELVRRVKPSKVIIDHSWEGGIGIEQWETCSLRLERLGVPFDRQLWLQNVSTALRFQKIKHNCVFYDFFLADITTKPSKPVPLLESRPAQGLCMIGKLRSKPHRAQQLWSFYNNAQLRSRLVCSTLESEPLSILARTYSTDFAEWCCKPRVNKVDIEHTNHGASCWGWPAPWKVYNNTCASFILETDTPTQLRAFITEKTYRTIHCGHPFILSAPSSVRDRLIRYGFRLFENVVPLKYDASNVDKTTELFNNLIDGAALVQEDVDHNRQLLKRLAVVERSKLYRIVNDFLTA